MSELHNTYRPPGVDADGEPFRLQTVYHQIDEYHGLNPVTEEHEHFVHLAPCLNDQTCADHDHLVIVHHES